MSEKMLAAVFHGPLDLRVERCPIPAISPDEVLIKVISTGICATDTRIYHGAHRMIPPGTVRILGHELTGDIVRIGSELKGFKLDQRVFVAPNIGCGQCKQCISGNNNRCPDYQAFGITLDGSFAQFMRVPANAILQGNLIQIEKTIDPAVAALIEPFACVLRGQDALNIQPGETVLVIGAGPIGTLHVLLARLRGAGRILVSELIPERVAQASDLDVDRVVNPGDEDLSKVISEETRGLGADVVIVAAPSHQAQAIALELAAIGGRINFFGGLPKDRPNIQLNSNLIHYKELIVTGTTGCSTDDCRKAAAIAGSGKIDLAKVIGARFPLNQALDAFQAAENRISLKIILEP